MQKPLLSQSEASKYSVRANEAMFRERVNRDLEVDVDSCSSTSHNNSSTTLHSEPSFSIYNNTRNQDSEDDNELATRDLSEALGSDEFTFGNKIGGRAKDFHGDLGEYYTRILKEEPSNPSSLRNYAQLLLCQGDISGAEEYYYRATLADPKDGEILMQYAKLIWEFHHDQDKALIYFERAVSAASDDSHVQAEYARFLWEIDESEEEEEDDNVSANTRTPVGTDDSITEDQQVPVSSPLHLAIGLKLGAPGHCNGLSLDNYAAASSVKIGNIEDHYKGMIVENPRDTLYLMNYAEFLYESKGDLAGALEYYSHATLVDPSDLEIVFRYAKLVWKVHRDKDKATTYFERAVQASPENSDVLGAYARFLWEAEEDEEEIPQGMHDQVPSFRAMTGESV